MDVLDTAQVTVGSAVRPPQRNPPTTHNTTGHGSSSGDSSLPKLSSNQQLPVAAHSDGYDDDGASKSSSSSRYALSNNAVVDGGLEPYAVGGGVDARYKWEWNNSCFQSERVPYLLLTIIGSCHGPFLFGYSLSVFNTSISVIGGQFLWCGYEGYTGCKDFNVYAGWAQNGLLIGGAITSVIGGILVNRIGCRKALIITDMLVAVGVIIGVSAVNFPMLMVSRLLIGFDGVFSVAAPTYVAEMTPPHMRGPYQVLMQGLLQLGVFVATLLGLPFTTPPSAVSGEVEPTEAQMAFTLTQLDKIWWRVMQLVPLFVVLSGIISFAVLYQHETPYFLVRRGHRDEAHAVLQRTRKRQDVSEELHEIEQFTLKGRADVYSNWLAWKILFTDKHAIRALLIGLFVSAVHQLGGISAFFSSSNRLFAEAGVDPDIVVIITNVLTGISFVATFLSIYLVEALGRRPLFLSGAFTMGLSVLPGGVMLFVNPDSLATIWVAIVGSSIFVVAFSLTWGAVTWAYMFEIFPVELKDQAGGIMTSANYVSAIIMIFAASLLPINVVFITFAVVNLFAGVVLSIFLRETRGYFVGDSPYFPKKPAEILDVPAGGDLDVAEKGHADNRSAAQGLSANTSSQQLSLEVGRSATPE